MRPFSFVFNGEQSNLGWVGDGRHIDFGKEFLVKKEMRVGALS
jgi:hypothetical protein